MIGRLLSLCMLVPLFAILLIAGCDRANDTNTRVIRVWSHQGQESENQAMRAIADSFNRAYAEQGVRVDLTFFPDFQYTEKVAIAAAARDLPDAFDLDGPLVARFVDAESSAGDD
jgi:multiple sugar transport system substrate-binding protein